MLDCCAAVCKSRSATSLQPLAPCGRARTMALAFTPYAAGDLKTWIILTYPASACSALWVTSRASSAQSPARETLHCRRLSTSDPAVGLLLVPHSAPPARRALLCFWPGSEEATALCRETAGAPAQHLATGRGHSNLASLAHSFLRPSHGGRRQLVWDDYHHTQGPTLTGSKRSAAP